MPLAEIRTQLKTVVAAVVDIGQVHDYERWAAEWSKVLETFKATIGGAERIQAWTITREGTAGSDHDVGQEWRSHLMVLRGYRGLDDTQGSEKQFQDLIETVCAALRAQRPANLAATVSRLGPAQVRIVEHRILGDVLCHYCEIAVQAEEVQA